ncbi:MAG: T9SS type A sorting domain-containing protein [Ignavibacteria bacterium]|nr:T9SS type A sorting domain-containing protein [Ignavibacteria bacterium]
MRKKLYFLLVVLMGITMFCGTTNAQWVEQNSGTTVNLISISAPTYQVAWVAGPAGTVKRTIDNGTTWVDKSIPGIGDLWNVYAFNESIAFVIGFDLTWMNNIWRTADGGNTWTVVLSLDGSFNFMNAMSFFNDMEGIVVGDPNYNYLPGPNHMLVYKTYDGGLTWAPIKHPPVMQGMVFGWKNSIEIVGKTVYFGTAVFDNDFNFTPDPYIFKSANKGETWTAKLAPGVVQVNTLKFTNKQVGYGCRGKSKDNGNTWFTMPDPYATEPNDINNFILSTTGVGNELWVTGIHRESPAYPGVYWNYPTIYYSNNAGMTWTLDYTITGTGGLNEVRISRDNRALYALRDNGGIVMKMLPGSYAKNQDKDKYLLKDNYPNPFNPATTISYQIPKNEFVTIRIYDMTGREVASLVNETKTAGIYNVTWNASGLASGIYFYKLQAGSFTEVKKMTLVK